MAGGRPEEVTSPFGGGERHNSTITEAHADAEVAAAVAASARDGAWHKVAPVPGATSGHA